MTEKSFVGMLHHCCPLCGNKKENETDLLLDKSLANSLEKDNYTLSPTLCERCKGKIDDGYVGMVEVTAPPNHRGDTLKQSEANRTGIIAWLKRDIVPQLFDKKFPSDIHFIFVDPELIRKLKSMVPPEFKEDLSDGDDS